MVHTAKTSCEKCHRQTTRINEPICKNCCFDLGSEWLKSQHTLEYNFYKMYKLIEEIKNIQ